MSGDDWDDPVPYFRVGFPRPVPVSEQTAWVVAGAVSAVTDAVAAWATRSRAQLIRPRTEGIVAQFGSALLYRAASKWGAPAWDKVPVRFTAQVHEAGDERCRVSVVAVANPGPMMPALMPYPPDHYTRRPHHLVASLLDDLTRAFTVDEP